MTTHKMETDTNCGTVEVKGVDGNIDNLAQDQVTREPYCDDMADCEKDVSLDTSMVKVHITGKDECQKEECSVTDGISKSNKLIMSNAIGSQLPDNNQIGSSNKESAKDQMCEPRSTSPEDLVIMEQVFEPRPSTSRDSGLNHIGHTPKVSPTAIPEDKPLSIVSESIEEKRQKMKFLPRTSQYEKHPLLQVRSETGLSELDMLLMDGEPTRTGPTKSGFSSRAYSLDEPEKTTSIRLEPRGAHSERGGLFQKTETGISILEQYLLEKESEMESGTSKEVYRADAARQTERRKSSHVHVQNAVDLSTGNLHPSAKAAMSLDVQERSETKPIGVTKAGQRRPPVLRSVSLCEGSAAQLQLQPRRGQYEKHHLLENKDDKGMTVFDHFLQEKEDEFKEKGKCSTKCTCKNISCPKCKGASPQLVTKEIEMVTRIDPKPNNKRVHFQRQDCLEGSPERDKSAVATSEAPTTNGKAQNNQVEGSVPGQDKAAVETEGSNATVANKTNRCTDSARASGERDVQADDAEIKSKRDGSSKSKKKSKRNKSVCCVS